ncbi:hypothetical protein QLQ12_25035 [Actinoplanes sp. NEAU-A12]|uniref:Uncharacterized protein n=1 Tax=Actinoplanes sandaracinus TaxID=3045177 RepID=A0ABT6WQ80_9ACTN|nr:hypothetical protein [Actinoplanes sandaracinus]MDI6101888.1 hypothetical protein [Actinoplanes sandaracinus]
MREHTDTYEALARRCEAGARDLEYEADNAAEVLAGRAGGDRLDPQQWAAGQRNAAQAAREYAAELRAEAGDQPTARLNPAQFAQAERVALAAELGGILIDGRPSAERIAQSSDYTGHNIDRELWLAGTHPAQQKAAEIEATGKFTHVAETIDGVKQVPFWRLGGPVNESTSTRDTARADRDGDEF